MEHTDLLFDCEERYLEGNEKRQLEQLRLCAKRRQVQTLVLSGLLSLARADAILADVERRLEEM